MKAGAITNETTSSFFLSFSSSLMFRSCFSEALFLLAYSERLGRRHKRYGTPTMLEDPPSFLVFPFSFPLLFSFFFLFFTRFSFS